MFLEIRAEIFLISLICYPVLLLYNNQRIWELLKKIPLWLISFNLGLLFYKLFFIPRIFSRGGDFGIWILGMAKSNTIEQILFSPRSPVYFFIIKLFSKIFGGIDYNFIANFNIILSFINVFSIFLLVWILFKDKIIAIIASLFYAISPIIFVLSQTEDYTNLAIFFSIQALLFAAIYIYKKRISFLWLALAASILAIGSRPEYIVFAVLFILFLWLFVKKTTRHYLIVVYILFILPLGIIALGHFINNAPMEFPIHGQVIRSDHLISDLITSHYNIFVGNLFKNLSALLNLYTLMGLFLAMAVLIIFFKIYKEYKQEILFFILYLLIFFLYYAILHNEGMYYDYRYIASLVIPIVILAAVGTKSLFVFKPKLTLLLLISIVSFSLYATFPNLENKFNFYYYDYYVPNNEIYEEYLIWRAHRDEIDLQEDVNFIANGNRTFFFSAFPIKEKNICCVSTKNELINKIRNSRSDRTIYVSQGIWGFGSLRPSYYEVIEANEFEKTIKELLTLDKEIFSYYIEEHHVFLYKMSVKESTN